VAWSAAGEPIDLLQVARFDRSLDTGWRRTSYSAITAAAHERLVASEPERGGIDDEPALDAVAGTGELPLSAMAAGPELGTVIHRAFERVDFAAEQPADAWLRALAQAAGTRSSGVFGCPVDAVAAGLATAAQTPVAGLSLRSVTRRDRLDELGFELPLAGGDRPVAETVSILDVAALLERFLPSEDPLGGYAERLRDPSLVGTLRGYLTGSIDLVLRLPGAERPRFAVVDYKTNWLASPDEPLRAWHYRRQALAQEMERSHYALQALLYLVALHRFLRWRLPGYDADCDLAGVHYLFLRGMLGPDGPLIDGEPTGVFSWQPPNGLVEALSNLLDGSGR
jgi:exodeoxyribonuclease V beta subunit